MFTLHPTPMLWQQGSFRLNPDRELQNVALVTALSEVLWQARQGAASSLVLPGGEGGMSASQLGYDQLSSVVVFQQLMSLEATQVGGQGVVA